MIGGIDYSSIRLASAYNYNNQLLSDTLSRIASGKKITRPSDDFSGYIRSNQMQSDIDSYQTIKENLTAAKGATGMAVEVGNTVYEDLMDLKDLVTAYYNTADSTNDNETRSEILTKFNNLKTSLTSYVSNTKYDGTTVFSAATLDSIKLDPDGTGSLAITFGATDIADATAPTLTGFVVGDTTTTGTNKTTDLTAINTQLTAATSYLAKSESYDKSIDRQLRISDTIIQSKQAAISMITDIDEVSEMNKKTDLQIRQQASIAMMAQAQMSRSSITRLFQ
jgi:flagellin